MTMKSGVLDYHYDFAVIGFCQTKDDPRRTVKILVHGLDKLTEKRMYWIARRLYLDAGWDEASWEKVEYAENLRFARTHMSRYKDVRLQIDYVKNTYSISTSTSSEGGDMLSLFRWDVKDLVP